MGTIRETLTLEDGFTKEFTRFISLANEAASAFDFAKKSINSIGTAQPASAAQSFSFGPEIAALSGQISQLNVVLSSAASGVSGFFGSLQDIKTATETASAEVLKISDFLFNSKSSSGVASSAFDQISESLSQLTQTSKESRDSLLNMETASASAALSVEDLSKKISSAERQSKTAAPQINGVAQSIKNLAGAYFGLQGIKSLLNLSDTFASNTARLNMMNDGMQTTAELQNAIFLAAQRSRGAYLETTNLVAKLGTLTQGVFDSNQQLVDFAEQLNKQIALSGASATGAQAAMLQLTQALSSGALRGEELNSILEQTPTIAQTIADYMGVTTGEMRELASDGAITADVVKNALLGAAEETDEAFEEMPMTWGQVWTSMQNIATKALEPVLAGVNFLANSVNTGIQWALNNMALVEPVLAMLAAGAIAVGVSMLWAGLTAAAGWIAANWPILAVIAAVGALIFIARQAGATWQEIGAVIGGVFGALYATAMNNCIVPLQRGFAALANFFGNVFNNPVAAIQVLFFDMALTVLGYIKNIAQGIENLINKIPGLSVNITSGIDSVYNMVQQASQKVKDESGWKEYVKAWDFVDYGGAIQGGSEIGANLGSALDNFDLEGTIAGLAGGLGAGGGGVSVPSYEELLKQTNGLGDINDSLSGIGSSVSNIEKEVSMSNEDLKSLVDMAERQYVAQVNLTSQTPVINITGQNTGNTAADRKAIADAIQVVLMEQLSSTSVRATAVPV